MNIITLYACSQCLSCDDTTFWSSFHPSYCSVLFLIALYIAFLLPTIRSYPNKLLADMLMGIELIYNNLSPVSIANIDSAYMHTIEVCLKPPKKKPETFSNYSIARPLVRANILRVFSCRMLPHHATNIYEFQCSFDAKTETHTPHHTYILCSFFHSYSRQSHIKTVATYHIHFPFHIAHVHPFHMKIIAGNNAGQIRHVSNN